MKANIIVRFTREGWHHWPTATEHRSYLGQSHRHLFYVEVRTPVQHDDREIEFHDLLSTARQEFPEGDFGAQSCEMLARDLGRKLVRTYARPFCVSVYEDNEVGAEVAVSAAALDR